MNLCRYRTEHSAITALVVTTARKWMTVLVVDGGRLRLIRRPVTDQHHMTPLATNTRRAMATYRRLARKRGTSRKIRAAVAELVQP